MILTGIDGQPIPRPDELSPGAAPQEVTAWLRAGNTYRDRVAHLASTAFDRQFRAALRKSKP